MSQLLDARGNPIKPFRRNSLPKVDKAIGQWAGRDSFFANLPGGGVLQFDLSRLTLADFRSMRMHYQLGASINVLSFVMHQVDWRIECESREIKDFLEEEIARHWTQLIFGFSQSFWAGYSPMAVNYENEKNYVRIKRIKDLVPEECEPNWKKVDGWAPYGAPKPRLWEYDGLKQNGFRIPADNTIWYPLLMENGDYWGRKLLKPAFPAWFFSNLVHLYANRYFERFGEPLPIGRAPFDDDVQVEAGQYVSGKKAMEGIISSIRNRSTVVLPSDRDPDGKNYDYAIEYLESQMRGADFERYLSRLDEEMSLSVFTPILLFRTADVGSYNLGQAHLKIFEQMINSLAGDQQLYLQKYLVDRLVRLNFGDNAPRATWTYRRLGTVDLSVYKEIVVEMVRQGSAKLDTDELGALIGVPMEAQEVLTQAPAEPGDTADTKKVDTTKKPKVVAARAPLQEAIQRAVRETIKGNTGVTLGYRNRVIDALAADGFEHNDASNLTDSLYGAVNTWLDDVAGVFDDPDRFKASLERVVDLQLQAA